MRRCRASWWCYNENELIHYFIHFSYHNSTRICCLCNKSQRQKIHVSAFAAAFLSQLKFFCHKDITTWTGLTTGYLSTQRCWYPVGDSLLLVLRYWWRIRRILLLTFTYCCTANIPYQVPRPKTWGRCCGVRSFPPNCDDGAGVMYDWARHFWYLKESKVY